MSAAKGIDTMQTDSIEFYYKRKNKAASYEQLYKYLERIGYKLSKIEGDSIPYDEDVASTFSSITQVDLYEEDFSPDENPVYEENLISIVDKIRTPFPMDHIVIDGYERHKKIEAQHKIDVEKRLQEDREDKSYKISESSFKWTKIGIWITVGLALVQIGISIYDIWWRDNDHELTMIQLDSRQIEQNKRVIEQDSIQVVQNQKIIELLQQNTE